LAFYRERTRQVEVSVKRKGRRNVNIGLEEWIGGKAKEQQVKEEGMGWKLSGR